MFVCQNYRVYLLDVTNFLQDLGLAVEYFWESLLDDERQTVLKRLAGLFEGLIVAWRILSRMRGMVKKAFCGKQCFQWSCPKILLS